MDYLYLELPLINPGDEKDHPDDDQEEEYECRVIDYLEDAVKYVNV